MKYIQALIVSLFFSFSLFSQNNEPSVSCERKFYKIGFNFGFGSVDNPVFHDDDYFYEVQFRKFQLYYKLKSGKFVDFQLLFQPEFNTAKHQLTSDRYIVAKDHPLYERREEMKKFKKFHEYIFNFGFQVSKNFSNNEVYLLASIGPGYFEKTTERMSKGIGFSDNLAIGYSRKIQKYYIDTRLGYRHASNAEINEVNDGYDMLVIDLGIGFYFN
ncbi:acyloxyacyl hydrolase [Zunongwangia sp.]|uniref:acyloxyacyl hydrolase n=1 Tax=Zunongwangia sp. TaxID=1965325 RepID=UPI003AA86F55